MEKLLEEKSKKKLSLSFRSLEPRIAPGHCNGSLNPQSCGADPSVNPDPNYYKTGGAGAGSDPGGDPSGDPPATGGGGAGVPVIGIN